MAPPTRLRFWLALLLGVSGFSQSVAQEEELQMALEMQDRRTAGLTALATQVKGLVYQYLPEWLVGTNEDEKETGPPVASTTVAVREIKITEVPTNAVETTRREEEELAYQRNLQEAVSKLNITGAFPQKKQIMVGAQNLAISDAIAIELKGMHYDLEILDITATELKMRDQKSRLEVSIAIGLSLALPPGMSREPPRGMFVSGKPAAVPQAPLPGKSSKATASP